MNVTVSQRVGPFARLTVSSGRCMGAQEQRVELKCPNCGATVTVEPSCDRAHCTNCSVMWDWKTKQPIRGQR